MELIGQHLGSDLSSLTNYEVFYREGDTGELRIYTGVEYAPVTLEKLEEEIISQGVVLIEPIVQDARVIFIKFRKEIAPLLIIVGVVAVIIVGIIGWQVFKTTQAGVPLWVWLIAGGALAYLIFTSKPAKEAGGLAIQAGKVYVTRKAIG